MTRDLLQAILPIDCHKLKFENLLPSTAPSVLVLTMSQQVSSLPHSLLTRPPTYAWPQTEKANSKYRLVAVVNHVAGNFEVVANSQAFASIEDGCLMTSNVRGESSVSLADLHLRAKYLVYQLVPVNSAMDD